jgi:hypothetical protein
LPKAALGADVVANAVPRHKTPRQVVLGLILLLVLVLLWRQYKSAHLRVAYSDYCRVERGMSRAEVESVFDGPAWTVRHDSWLPWAGTFVWEGYAGSARVTFDATGRVIDKEHSPRVDCESADALTRKKIRDHWDVWWITSVRD